MCIKYYNVLLSLPYISQVTNTHTHTHTQGVIFPKTHQYCSHLIQNNLDYIVCPQAYLLKEHTHVLAVCLRTVLIINLIPSGMVTTEAVLSPAQLEAVMLTMCISLYDRVRVVVSGPLEGTVRVALPAPVRV